MATLVACLLGLSAAVAPGCASTSLSGGASGGDWHYTIRTDAERSIDVSVCFDGRPPSRLMPGLERAGRYLRGAWDSRGRALPRDPASGDILLDSIGPGECGRYEVDLRRLGEGETLGPHAIRLPGAVAATAGLWLWRPPRPAERGHATATFDLPLGVSVSAPWTDRDPQGRYRVPSTTWRWSNRFVFGPMTRLVWTQAGTTVDVAVLGQVRSATDEGVAAWLREALGAVATLGGGLPAPHIQVVVMTVPAAADPVLFGMALRGGGPALVLLLDAFARDAALPGEWVAVHELFHLGMPYVRSQDAWLSEGVTTFYQEVLRARAGLISPGAAWQHLADGFDRGRVAGTHRRLPDESRMMSETRSYRRVYWAGAAIALAWDVAIRRASSGTRSLDDAILELRRCCMEPARAWAADELIDRLAEASGDPLFSETAAPYLSATGFPAVEEAIWPDLGVRRGQDGRVRMDPDAPEARLCEDLMRRPRAAAPEPGTPPPAPADPPR